MTKYKIIVNPTSGRGTGELSIPQIEQLFRSYKFEFNLERTQKPWHAVELTRKAIQEGYDVIVSAGGDGTANEVLNGIMQAKKENLGTAAMGVICVGRGNDFAFGMNIPMGVEAGCQVIQKNYRKLIDVGLVEGGLYPQGRYFGNGVGIGFDAVVGFVALKMKRLHGFISYLVAAIKTIFLYYHAPKVKLEFNGQSQVLSTLMVSIMIGRRMGGGFMMAPEAITNDGLFDLCIATQVSRARIFALIPRFMQGTQATHSAIQTARTKSLKVTALEGVLPAHADGETLCTEGTQLNLTLLPSQIEIICAEK